MTGREIRERSQARELDRFIAKLVGRGDFDAAPDGHGWQLWRRDDPARRLLILPCQNSRRWRWKYLGEPTFQRGYGSLREHLLGPDRSLVVT